MTHAFRFRLPAAAMCAALAVSLGACAKETHVVRKAHMDAKAANMRGNELYRRGDLASAAREYDRAKLIALGVDDREMVAEAHNNLGLLLMAAGDYAGAVAKFDEALSINEAIGNMPKAAANLMNRGEASLSRGSLDDARDDAERAQRLSR
nr:tetratricopeptide repeat protein [bacterium]